MVYFLLGILLVSFILPLLDGLTGLFLTMIETAKGYFTVKVTEYNCRLKKLAYEDDEPPRHLIGFARDDTEEDEEDDDDI